MAGVTPIIMEWPSSSSLKYSRDIILIQHQKHIQMDTQTDIQTMGNLGPPPLSERIGEE